MVTLDNLLCCGSLADLLVVLMDCWGAETATFIGESIFHTWCNELLPFKMRPRIPASRKNLKQLQSARQQSWYWELPTPFADSTRLVFLFQSNGHGLERVHQPGRDHHVSESIEQTFPTDSARRSFGVWKLHILLLYVGIASAVSTPLQVGLVAAAFIQRVLNGN